MAQTPSKSDYKDAIAKLGMYEEDSERLIPRIAKNILRKMYKGEPSNDFEAQRNKKIEDAYKKLTGSAFRHDGQKVRTISLFGPPGHGKTTAYREAAKMAASMLGMNFVDNPDFAHPNVKKRYKPSRDDFLFVSIEMAAENSKAEIGGIPGKMKVTYTNNEGEEVTGEYMEKLINGRLAAIKLAGSGFLLLDDFLNASPVVQGVGLSLTDESRLGSLNLDEIYIGVTGNVAGLDGSAASRPPTPLLNRCFPYFVVDKLDQFITRMLGNPAFMGPAGDAGISGLLKRTPDLFWDFPDPKKMGGFNSPRSWDYTTIELCREIEDAGNSMEHALPHLQSVACAGLGNVVGLKVRSYIEQRMNGADPLAKAMIEKGEWSNEHKELFKKRYGEGHSQEEQDFEFQYAIALADYAAQKIVNDPKHTLDSVINHFTKGCVPLSYGALSFGIDHLADKLAYQIEDFSEEQKMVSSTRRVLKYAIKDKIVGIVAKTDGVDGGHIETVIDAITGANKWESKPTVKRRKA